MKISFDREQNLVLVYNACQLAVQGISVVSEIEHGAAGQQIDGAQVKAVPVEYVGLSSLGRHNCIFV